MTKQDRAKMQRRLANYIARLMPTATQVAMIGIIDRFAAREVARAVRAERKAQRDTEGLRSVQLLRAEKQIVERALNLGRKRL